MRISVVEETLEEVVGLLRWEPAGDAELPTYRDGWFIDNVGRVARIATALITLVIVAFEAECDRRALLTGCRIPAVATGSPLVSDLQGLRAYACATNMVTADAFMHKRTSRT